VAGGHGGRNRDRVAAGTALLREPAERVGLRAEYSTTLEGLGRRRGGQHPGQVLVDLAVTLADGGEAIGDIAAPTDQAVLHGPVASPATAWRVLAGPGRSWPASTRTGRPGCGRLGRSPGRGPDWPAPR
jgi:hypothetical protein